MTEFRQNLVDRITQIFGSKHPCTIQFIQSCEYYTKSPNREIFDLCLQHFVEEYEKDPQKSIEMWSNIIYCN